MKDTAKPNVNKNSTQYTDRYNRFKKIQITS